MEENSENGTFGYEVVGSVIYFTLVGSNLPMKCSRLTQPEFEESLFFANKVLGMMKTRSSLRRTASVLLFILQGSGCTVEPVMSKAGIMTHPRCAKYSTEEAVATCEAGLQGSTGPRFSVGVGFSRRL